MRSGIYCIELDLDGGNLVGKTAVPFLKALGYFAGVPSICVRVNSATELLSQVGKWTSSSFDRYPILLLNFHGSLGSLEVFRREICISQVAKTLRFRAHRRFVHFSSCDSLALSDHCLREFLNVSGANGVSGYSSTVAWEDAIPLEFVWLEALTSRGIGPRGICESINYMAESCEGLAVRAGFTVAALLRSKID